ncbi:MAG: DoxX family protein [Phycisphaerales bacterium]|nr:DoxX family protein [Phycisphaerales bacterium]
MSFSRTAGVTIVPLLSRIVLGAAFLLAGWYHCFSNTTFTDDQVQQIEAMQTNARPVPTIHLAALQGNDNASEPAEAEAEPPADPNSKRAVYHFALDLHSWGITKGAIPLAWGIAVFEIVAGALVLLGLFTRLWGFLMAGLIGTAFVLTSVQRDAMFDVNPFTWRGDPSSYYELFFQLAAFVLAIGLFVTGPGVLALDSMVFGRRDAPPATPPASS